MWNAAVIRSAPPAVLMCLTRAHSLELCKCITLYEWGSATSSQQRQQHRKENTVGSRAGRRSEPACMHPERLRTAEGRVSCSTQTPMNSPFWEIPCKALLLEDRARSCLHVPSNSFKHQQTCTQSAIEGEQAGLSFRGKEYSPVFSSFTWCSWTRRAECCVEDKNISQEKEISVVISVGFSLNKPFHHFRNTYPLIFTLVMKNLYFTQIILLSAILSPSHTLLYHLF